MNNLITRIFAKNADSSNDEYSQNQYLKGSAEFGMISNVVVILFKAIAAVVSGSVAILGDLLNNCFDVMTSVSRFVKYKRKSAENTARYVRYELITNIVLISVLLLVGIELVIGSLGKILNPTGLVVDTVLFIVFVIATIISFIFLSWHKRVAYETGNDDMYEVANQTLLNIIFSIVGFILMIAGHFLKLNIIDAVVGFFFFIVICYRAYYELRYNTIPLLQAIEDNDYRKLKLSKTYEKHAEPAEQEVRRTRRVNVPKADVEKNEPEFRRPQRRQLNPSETPAENRAHTRRISEQTPSAPASKKPDEVKLKVFRNISATVREYDSSFRPKKMRISQTGENEFRTKFLLVVPDDFMGSEDIVKDDVLARLEDTYPSYEINFDVVLESDYEAM